MTSVGRSRDEFDWLWAQGVSLINKQNNMAMDGPLQFGRASEI